MNTEDTGRTPGRAAYEAMVANRAGPDSVGVWDVLAADARAAWEAAAQAAIATRMNTAEDPQAELAALHELLAAIAAAASAASVPLPASEGNPADMQAYYEARSNRLNYINLLASIQPGASALLIRSNAQAMARLAAEPLPYQAEAEEDAPEERGVSEYHREEFMLEHPEDQP